MRSFLLLRIYLQTEQLRGNRQTTIQFSALEKKNLKVHASKLFSQVKQQIRKITCKSAIDSEKTILKHNGKAQLHSPFQFDCSDQRSQKPIKKLAGTKYGHILN